MIEWNSWMLSIESKPGFQWLPNIFIYRYIYVVYRFEQLWYVYQIVDFSFRDIYAKVFVANLSKRHLPLDLGIPHKYWLKGTPYTHVELLNSPKVIILSRVCMYAHNAWNSMGRYGNTLLFFVQISWLFSLFFFICTSELKELEFFKFIII